MTAINKKKYGILRFIFYNFSKNLNFLGTYLKIEGIIFYWFSENKFSQASFKDFLKDAFYFTQNSQKFLEKKPPRRAAFINQAITKENYLLLISNVFESSFKPASTSFLPAIFLTSTATASDF